MDTTGTGDEAREQLVTVLATVPHGVLIIDRNERIAHMNEPCRAMLQLPPEHAGPGAPARAMALFCARRGDYGPGDPEEQVAELFSLFSLKEPQSYQRTIPDGRSVTARSHPLPGGGVVVTFADETEYRHAVDDLYQSNMTLERSVAEHAEDLARVSAALDAATARAEEAARSKARTLAIMNQELRMPVAGMVESLRGLMAAALGPEERRHVSTLLHSLESLRLLLDDLGDLARLEADEVTLESAPFAVETVVGSVLSGLAERAETADVRLTGAVDTAVPPTVVGDAAWVRHVLVELVALALRRARGGTIAVTAEPGLLPDLEAGLRFSVEGVPAEAMEEVAGWLAGGMLSDDLLHARRAGLRGLGLHICRRIVALMGGEIGVRPADNPATGGTLWFTAALAAAPDAGAAREDRPARSILVVEDNPVNQRVNAWLLQREGHRVTVVGNGRDAVEIAARGGFDAVLMDLDLPGLDGIAATRAIRALNGPAGRVPVIAITTSALPGDIDRCRAAGMDDHLPKPVNPAALMRILGRLTAAGRPPMPAAGDDGIDEGVLAALEGVVGRPNVVELVGDFLEHAAAVSARLSTAQAGFDLDGLAAAAAEVKSMAGTVGLPGVLDAAAGLERLAREGRRDEAMDASVLLVRRLERGAARLRQLWAPA